MLKGSAAPVGGGGSSDGDPGQPNSSALVLEASLDALRRNGLLNRGASDDWTAVTSVVASLLSDGNADSSLLIRVHRRKLLSFIAENTEEENFNRVIEQTVPQLKLSGEHSAADTLLDMGPSLTAKTTLMVLERFGFDSRTSPAKMAELLARVLLASVGSPDGGDALPLEEQGARTINFTALAHAMRSLYDSSDADAPTASLIQCFRGLDSLASFSLPAGTRLDGLAIILRSSAKGTIAGLWGVWKESVRQLNLISGLLAVGSDVEGFSFAELGNPPRLVLSSEDIANASPTIQDLAAGVLSSSWNSLDLVETLANMADTSESDIRSAVTELLEKAVTSNAELVLMGLIQVPRPWNTVHAQLVQQLLAMFIAGHPSYQLVYYRIWQVDWRFLLSAFRSAYSENPLVVTSLLDAAQDLKILDTMLDFNSGTMGEEHSYSSNVFFALDLAALASRREYLNLDKWLQDRITESLDSARQASATTGTFIPLCFEFLDGKVRDELAVEQRVQPELTTVQLTVHTVAIFLRVLRANGDRMSADEIDAFKAARNLSLQLHPRLMNLAPGAETQEPGMQVVSFSPEIHKEADSWYTRMYEETITIDDFVTLLQRTKASSDPHDQQLFACLAHTLFDEYRCFETVYPARELAMTAIVFGSLIQHQLIDYIPLGIAIRYVLDALRTSPESNMFKFGLQALLRFQNRLSEWPQLGQALLALPHLIHAHPDLERIIRNATSGGQGQDGQENTAADEQVNDAAGTEEVVAAQTAPFTAINSDDEEAMEGQKEPEVEVSDKILFIVNNLSPSNLQTKLEDARRYVSPEIYRWFCSYLVLQRVSIEPNNHGLYADFLDGLDFNAMLPHILRETYAKVKVLLNSDKTLQSTTERQLLKNLGSWLGSLTLARDKPIRHRNMAFKDLLVQGYDSNRLIVAIPFVCKVLEQCNKSSVFVPPNPWLMAVLRLMVELYQFADLKLNLKFEIEVLCKTLNIDLKEMQPTTILRSRPTAEELAREQAAQQAAQAQAVQQHAQQQLFLQQQQQQEQQLLRRQQAASGSVAAAPFERGAYPAGSRDTPDGRRVGSGASATAGAGSEAYADSLSFMLQNLANYIVINPQIQLFANNATLKRMVYLAIDRAIREIIAPVAERSVTIASVSTRELVTKDFAMEGDEAKMRKAAHQMAQNLAGSLALVTCKEPLRISMVTHARTLFLQSGFTEQTLPEQAIVVIMLDNLDLACSIIERAAMEKALPDIDDGLSHAFAARRDHRARGRGYFWDSAALTTSQYAATLPDLLRLRPDGLQPQQLRVYEDFGKLVRPPSAEGDRASSSSYSAAEVSAPYADVQREAEQALDNAAAGAVGVVTAQHSLEKFGQYMAELDRLLVQADSESSLSALPPNHDVRVLLRQIPLLAAQSASLDETALAFSQKVVQLLYKTDVALVREAYIVLLERLCEVSVKVAKEVTAWLVYAEDERKFNVPVTVGLIRAGLINIAEQDAQVAKIVNKEFKGSAIDFAAKLALECLRAPACATRAQLAHTIEALQRAGQRGKATDSAALFLEELEGGQLKAKADIGNTALREQLAYCFAEWVRLFQQSPNAEKSFIDFVTQLQTQGILKGEEISSMFFRVCTEVSVDSHIKQKAAGGSVATGIFSPIDAFSKLVVLMIKYHADPTGANNEQAKVHYLTKVLSIVVLVLAQSHEELGQHFQQKPFFRFFSSLLHDLHLAEPNLQSAYVPSILAIGNTLNTLQPSFFPGFTFSWMSLISHRLFMPKLLLTPNREGWGAFHRLFCSLLRFLSPFLRSVELRETSRSLYRGTLRILLVLLHDFPEFLCEYHHSLCDIVPTSCIQLRNLILSAFPRDRRLPDPFTPNLKIDRLPDVAMPPPILSDYTVALQPAEFKTALESLLRGDGGDQANFLSTHKDALLLAHANEVDADKGETRYNVPLINAMVLNVGIGALDRPQNILKGGNAQEDIGVEIFQQLMSDLDPEGRYLVLTAAANQLRFPCSHSAYFSYLILYLFAETNDELVKEQIARVLLERLIVNRPHPWALLLTTFELLRNRRYRMPKAPPEIERLLQHMREGLTAAPTPHTNGSNDVMSPTLGGGSSAASLASAQA